APAFIINNTNGSNPTALEVQNQGTNALTVSPTGQLALVGNQLPDITTLTGGSSLEVEPATNSANTGLGGALSLTGGTESGTGGTGGNVTINGGLGATNG